MKADNFFLGTHECSWFGRTEVPLFVNRRRLVRQKKHCRALGKWAMDSGGFTEIAQHGSWQLSEKDYLCLVKRYYHDIGNMTWAAPQDWMCEPQMLAKTGFTVAKHQHLTVYNLMSLRAQTSLFAGVIIPVLQGWSAADYLRCIDLYERNGIHLGDEPIVGVGTVCRRQGTKEAVEIFNSIIKRVPGIKLHGFGFKTLGLQQMHGLLESSDSTAWSLNARYDAPPADHKHGKYGLGKCANCLLRALDWRNKVINGLQ